jgi:hypothetical protein
MPLIPILAGLLVAAQSVPANDGPASEEASLAAMPLAVRAPDDSEWQEVLAADRTFHACKRATFITGMVGNGAMVTGAVILTFDVMFAFMTLFSHDGSSDDGLRKSMDMSILLMEGGAIVEGAALVGAVVTTAEGVHLRNCEHRTGYRVTLVPVVAPRASGYGAVARVEF